MKFSEQLDDLILVAWWQETGIVAGDEVSDIQTIGYRGWKFRWMCEHWYLFIMIRLEGHVCQCGVYGLVLSDLSPAGTLLPIVRI